MAFNTSLRPLATREFKEPQARHLLNRAGFGGTTEQVRALVQMGLTDAVDLLLNYERIDDSDLPSFDADSDIVRPPTREEQMELQRARRENNEEIQSQFQARRNEMRRQDRRKLQAQTHWWLLRMIATPRPMQENLVLLWHGHFATRYRGVEDSYLLYQQNQMFRRRANGSFADLARGIVRDPAMIRFLNNDSNRRQRPNENLARELMELFTLGVGNYTEFDIKQGARALTGYGVDDNEFMFHDRAHDPGEKTILGESGAFTGDDFVNILLTRPECPRFVAYKLYKHLVADVHDSPTAESQAVIDQLADLLRQDDYELLPALRTLLASEHFYDRAIMGNKIKSPAQLLIGTMRALDVPVRSDATLTEAMGLMGQQLFDPPSVAGWDGGRAWINTSTLFVRQNLCVYLLTGKLPFNDGWSRETMNYDPSVLLADIPRRTPEVVVDTLLAALILTDVTPARRGDLVNFLQQRGNINNDTLIGLLLLITAMPEYQLC